MVGPTLRRDPCFKDDRALRRDSALTDTVGRCGASAARSLRPSRAVQEPRFRRIGARQETPAHTKAPEGTGGRTARRLATAPNKSGVITLRPKSSLDGLATIEPGFRDRPEDRSSVRSGGSHLPLRAGRNVPAGSIRPQPPYPRTSSEWSMAYPRDSPECGRNVDGHACSIHTRPARRRFLQREVGRWHDCWLDWYH